MRARMRLIISSCANASRTSSAAQKSHTRTNDVCDSPTSLRFERGMTRQYIPSVDGVIHAIGTEDMAAKAAVVAADKEREWLSALVALCYVVVLHPELLVQS